MVNLLSFFVVGAGDFALQNGLQKARRNIRGNAWEIENLKRKKKTKMSIIDPFVQFLLKEWCSTP